MVTEEVEQVELLLSTCLVAADKEAMHLGAVEEMEGTPLVETGNGVGGSPVVNIFGGSGFGGSGHGGSHWTGLDTCLYTCEKTDTRTGGCSVRLNSKSKRVNGSSLGSCFSEIAGGQCSGIPNRCHNCLTKCKGRPNAEFTEFANP